MPYIIVDLDNCISNDCWRQEAIKRDTLDFAKRYEVYHSLMPFDLFHNRHLVDRSNDGYKNVINTGRPERYRAMTETWLKRNDIDFLYLIMRPDSALHIPTVLVKEQNLIALLQRTEDYVVSAYDDRHDVIEMYTRHHIKAERIAIFDHIGNE